MSFNGGVSLQKNFPDYLRPSIGKGSDDLFIRQILMVSLQCQEAALARMHLPGLTSLLSSCTTQVGKVNTKWLVTDEMGITM